MPMCEPENTEISRTIEKELLNQVDESWALQRKKALKDLYVGNPPPVGRTCAVERPVTPKWLFRGHQYHGIKTKEAQVGHPRGGEKMPGHLFVAKPVACCPV
ncbi:unnamed protein product [Symbiodinium sp. KB8]|nr:unnamed protein product [Symbiodinium sp. KB8]